MQRLRRFGWSLVLGLGLAVTVTTVLCAFISMLPGHSLWQETVGLVWTNWTSHAVLASLMALLVGLAGRRKRPRRLATATTVFAVLALLASTVFTARVMAAARAAGGSVNPFAALAISPFESAAPDVREVYTTTDGRALEVWIWKPASGATSSGAAPAPVIFEIHGGGWFQGTPPGTANMRWFADQGWLVVSVDYRLSSATKPTWDKAPRDVACALVWTARHAARFGGDPQRIVASGQSAGGNLAVNLSYAAALGRAESGCGGEVPVPQAVVTYVPVVDPQDAYDRGVPMPGMEPQWFTSQYIGGTPDTLPDRMGAISSATYLSTKAPPTLIIEPVEDGFIPAEGVFRFAERARAAGVDMTVVRLPVVNHYATSANTVADQAIRTVTQRYLVQRGLAPPAPR